MVSVSYRIGELGGVGCKVPVAAYGGFVEDRASNSSDGCWPTVPIRAAEPSDRPESDPEPSPATGCYWEAR